MISMISTSHLTQVIGHTEHSIISCLCCAGPALRAPSVSIRRSLPDLLKGNMVVLECDITQLSSSSLYVTFQANGFDVSERQYVDPPEATELQSITRRFSVPSKYWIKDKTFTCKVTQGFSNSWLSNTIKIIFGG